MNVPRVTSLVLFFILYQFNYNKSLVEVVQNSASIDSNECMLPKLYMTDAYVD